MKMTPPPSLAETVELFNPNVRKNTKLAHKSEFPVPVAFHITTPGVPNPFWPRLPASGSSQEDQTVPRIITASTLVGCMNGACYILGNGRDRKSGKDRVINYYHILGIHFEWCMLPNNTLVYDAEDTQEQWLITYDKETKSYRHHMVGEFFLHAISEVVTSAKEHNPTQTTFYCKINKDKELPITTGVVLKEGYYKLVFDFTNYISTSRRAQRMRFDDDSVVKVESVTEEVYDSFRKISVKKGL